MDYIFDTKSRIKTYAHYIHSFIATKTLLSSWESTLLCCLPDNTAISSSEPITLASTRPFDCLVTNFWSKETKLFASASFGAI